MTSRVPGRSLQDLLPLEDLGVGLTSESRVLLVGANARKLLPDLQVGVRMTELLPAYLAASGERDPLHQDRQSTKFPVDRC